MWLAVIAFFRMAIMDGFDFLPTFAFPQIGYIFVIPNWFLCDVCDGLFVIHGTVFDTWKNIITINNRNSLFWGGDAHYKMDLRWRGALFPCMLFEHHFYLNDFPSDRLFVHHFFNQIVPKLVELVLKNYICYYSGSYQTRFVLVKWPNGSTASTKRNHQLWPEGDVWKFTL